MQTAADQKDAEILKLATQAKEQGQGFLELQIEAGTSQQKSNFSATGVYSHRETKSHAGLLSAVEQIGWHLEHVTYVFTPTHQKTHKSFMGGENAAISGVVMGIYLFRTVDTNAS
jgi:hypothetical protein